MWIHLLLLVGIAASGVPQGGRNDAASQQATRRIADQLPTAQFNWGTDVSGPLCGIYAACTAVELNGLKANPGDFLASRYSGNCGGSTPDEVANVVRDAGANAYVLTHLSAMDVRLFNGPIIANVRPVPASNRFNHWVVVVPNRHNVQIYDGLEQPYHVSTAEFLGVWNGIGVCVTKDKESALAPIWLARISMFLAVVIVGVVPFKKFDIFARTAATSAITKVIALCSAAGALCIIGNLIFFWGLIASCERRRCCDCFRPNGPLSCGNIAGR